MTLLLHHPELANRDCQHCLKWIYKPTGGLDCDKHGKPVPRLKSGPSTAPCRNEKLGCPKGAPESKRSLDPQNEKAYRHYMECKATNTFPDDAIVIRNAGIIRSIEDEFDRTQQRQLSGLLEAFITASVSRGAI